jgi:hypothetical protein
MAALDFPNSPTVGQAFSSGGTIWTWDGVKWNGTVTSPTVFVQKAAGQMKCNHQNGEREKLRWH